MINVELLIRKWYPTKIDPYTGESLTVISLGMYMEEATTNF